MPDNDIIKRFMNIGKENIFWKFCRLLYGSGTAATCNKGHDSMLRALKFHRSSKLNSRLPVPERAAVSSRTFVAYTERGEQYTGFGCTFAEVGLC